MSTRELGRMNSRAMLFPAKTFSSSMFGWKNTCIRNLVFNRFRAIPAFSTSTSNKLAKMPGELGNNAVLKFTKVVPHAFPPTKGSAKAAGYDLKSAYDYTVPAQGKEMIDTGIKIQLPEGCYGRVAPRSGLAAKHFIDVGAGVIDEDYRGIVKVILFNHSQENFVVKAGDRIAQLICERIYYPEIEEVQELTDTTRGEGGFGSTGTN